MIAVHTSVWVDHLNDDSTPQVGILRDIISNRRARLVVGDLVLCEVLQGLGSDRDAGLVEAALRRFDVVPMVNPDLAIKSARNYRGLRALGITVRKTIDMLIGTCCVERGYALLHDDRDYDAMERHLGLEVVR